MDSGESSYRRFLKGDDSGISEIVEEYKDGLILYLNGYVKNIYTAEELTEDTFFRLITKKPGFSGKCSFKTWLYAIGRNTAVDYIRRNKKKSASAIDEIGELVSQEQSLEESYIKTERQKLIRFAVSKLGNDYRNILWLVYFEDFSTAEAAVILRKSRRQATNLLYRAKQALKTELEKEGFIYYEEL